VNEIEWGLRERERDRRRKRVKERGRNVKAVYLMRQRTIDR